MTPFRKQRCAWAIVASLSVVGCGASEDLTPSGPRPVEELASSSAALTEVNAVRPNAATARSNVHGVPDDVNLVNDVKDTAAPDFDASYIEGGSPWSSSVDLAYPLLPGGDVAVSYVNVKYFARNSTCTAPLICGRAYSQLLRGTTVIATSAEHDLPDMTQGWYLFNDTYNVPAGTLKISELRTRVVISWPYRATTGIRVSTVASDFRY